MSLSFSKQFEDDMDIEVDKVNTAISKAALSAWHMAVDSTPAPPTPGGLGYKRTGRLRAGWKLKKGSPNNLIPAMGKYNAPMAPSMSFDILKDKYFSLFNNVPYAVYIEEGTNSTPVKMMFKAKIKFNAVLRRGLK